MMGGGACVGGWWVGGWLWSSVGERVSEWACALVMARDMNGWCWSAVVWTAGRRKGLNTQDWEEQEGEEGARPHSLTLTHSHTDHAHHHVARPLTDLNGCQVVSLGPSRCLYMSRGVPSFASPKSSVQMHLFCPSHLIPNPS